MIKALRITDRYNLGANLDAVGIAKCYCREIRTFNLQHCEVQIFAGAKQFRFIWFCSAVHCNLNDISILDYMLVS
ncbi:hypothetical protein D3C74_377020 [compost metagenome]